MTTNITQSSIQDREKALRLKELELQKRSKQLERDANDAKAAKREAEAELCAARKRSKQLSVMQTQLAPPSYWKTQDGTELWSYVWHDW